MKNLVNGKFISSNEVIDIKSPIDNEFIASVPSMSKEDVDLAMSSARNAFELWSNLSGVERAKYIYRIAEELEKMKEEIANIMVVEIAKPYKAALTEVERTVELIKYSAEEGLRITGEIFEGGNYDKDSNNKLSLVRYKPYGVVLAIAPFNYPINLSASKIIPALIGGNVVIFKPPTQGSVSALKFVEAIGKAGLPNGVVNSVTGKGSKIGDYLNTHKEVDFINFTGSTGVGQSISKITTMKPMIMELGGKDAAIVLKDSNLEKAAKNIISGAFSYSGQRCTAIKRVLVENEVADKLVELLDLELSKLSVGSAKEGADITELIDENTSNYIENLIKETMELGRKTNQKFLRKSNLIYPMIFDFVDEKDRLAIEEPFGPVLPIIRVENIEEAIRIANSSEFGLQSSVFTNDIEKAFKIADKLEVGSVHINNKTQRGPDNFPFIGYKNSGMGVQGIKSSIMSMLKVKTIVFDI